MRGGVAFAVVAAGWAVVACCLVTDAGHAQAPPPSGQRPLATVDPAIAEAGWAWIETGAGYAHDHQIPASGLRGDVLRLPELTLRVGVSRRVELRVDTGYDVLLVREQIPAPLSADLDFDGESSSDIRDPVIATLVQLRMESAAAPALGLRLATRLPIASNQSGLGLDTTDFFVSLLAAKNAGALRWIVNLGLGILEVPTEVTSQNDVLTYGLTLSRRVGERLTFAAGLDGHLDPAGQVHPGTEDTSVLRLGARFGGGSAIDAALLVGLADVDAPIGFTVGVTRAVRIFQGS